MVDDVSSDVRPTQSGEPTFVVGIGASAGGLEALERLFVTMPCDTGMSFVVVQHLSPDFDSMMNELLHRQTDIPVLTVTDGMSVEPNAIYLIPPRKEMIISEGKLLLKDKDPEHGLTLPIDQFFRSLAQDCGDRSIGIILSGTGSDGSRGIRAIHDAGGMVIVQDEETAKFDGMPKSAMATGIVDVVLAPEAVADALGKYAQHPVASDLVSAATPIPVDEGDLSRLMRLLRNACGIDFSLYKSSTVTRRIERRLLLSHSIDFERYVDQVENDPDELNSLYQDLLIGVTQFFRDSEAFDTLGKKAIPDILSRLEPTEEVRMWVAGCATGEEAYSLAMLLHEEMVKRDRPIHAKVLATDVHKRSLDFASAGVYAADRLADVSPERLKRYFRGKGEFYQVVPELRQMIVFAPHDIIKDAPFTKLDLISCRNLLIYLRTHAQKKAISLFHFGLKTGGVLLLGPSEGVGDLESEFRNVDRRWKLYRKRRDVKLSADLRLPIVSGSVLHVTRNASRNPALETESTLRTVYDQLLDDFVPSGVLVNGVGEVVHVFGKAGQYLAFGKGRTSTNLIDLCTGELRTAVSGAVQRASKQRMQVAYSGVSVPETGRNVKLTVKPLIDHSSHVSHFLVAFEDERPSPIVGPEEFNIGEVSQERILALEDQLRHAKENLQATVEELETSNEELQATNEELVASNEELQSTNEELHSVNEELYTVNAEYQRKIGELTEITDDMENLLSCTDIGVLFLDKDLCIRRFTPRIAESFNILERDIGRSFDNFTGNIQYAELLQDMRAVIETGEPIEKKVRDRLNHWYLLRLLPYSTKAHIDGVVLTLVDIQSIRDVELKLEKKDQQLQGILDNSPSLIFVKDLERRYVLANRRSKKFLQTTPENTIGLTDFDLLPQEVADRFEAQDRSVLSEGKNVEVVQVVRIKGKSRVLLSTKYPLRDEEGRITSLAGSLTDITRQKRSEARAKKAVKHRDQFLAMLSHELRNPLAAVQNASAYLLRFEDGDSAIRNITEVLGRQVGQMGRLIEDLLDISRISRKRFDIRMEVVDLRDVAKEAELTARSLTAAHQLSLEVSLPTEAVNVLGDPARLQQVFVNLLNNAAKYTAAGGSVFFGVEAKGAEAVVVVRDTGLGMSPSLLKKAFEPFVQADETLDRADGGMGVGLTLVRSIVSLHEGSVEAHSEGKGTGSEFFVRLPLTDRSPATDSSVGGSPFQFDTSNALRIMIVEDNPDVREMMQRLLALDGHSVTVAADGIAALAQFNTVRPDVALVDIGLPELNGYEVAKRIRQRASKDQTLLIAVTGYGQPADREATHEAGFDQHMTKPIDMFSLNELLAEIATSKELKAEEVE